MDAIQMLKQDHEKAKQMFAKIQEASGEERGKLWAKLKPELKVHEQIEEAGLYGPVARDAGSKDKALKEWEGHHHEEVGEAEALIEEISALEPSDEEWLDKVLELQEALEHHIEEEEGEIWPKIQKVWDRTKLEQAGAQMETLKRQKMQQAA
jgi:hemerythrin-like domain-containing protein